MAADDETIRATLKDNLNPEDLSKISVSRHIPTIEDFMAKPYRIATGSFTTAGLVDSTLFSFSISNSIYTNALWIAKLKGYSLWRGTAVVRVQVNASPFHAGMLLLHFLPQFQHRSDTLGTHNANLQTKSQQPSMRFDISENEAIMKIPYIAPKSYFSTQSGRDDWGTVFCSVMSPLKTGPTSPQDVDYVVWLSFEDFEVEGPSAQMAVRKGQKGSSKAYTYGQPTEAEVKPVSSMLRGISGACRSLMSVPILLPYAAPAAWFTNALAGAASAFGWSKPVDDNTHMKVNSDPHMYSANSNSVDQSAPLSVLTDNKLTIMPGFVQGGLDEMSLAFIKSQWAYGTTLEWNSTLPTGASIYSGAVFPYMFETPVDTSYVTMSPVGFLSKLFTYWRGGLQLKLRLVKTQFHSGRFIVAFDPAKAVSSDNTSDYLYRSVYDIRSESEIIIKLPYLKATQYLDTDGPDPLGYINFFVLNELRAPATVSTSIEIIVEISACEDFEFAVPTVDAREPVLPQGFGDDNDVLEGYVGDAIQVTPVSASQYCMGELVLSISQLLRRYSLWKNTSSLTDRLRFRPFSLGAFRKDGLGSVNPPMLGLDYLSTFSSMYAFQRGGVRIKLVSTPEQEDVFRVSYYAAHNLAVVSDTNTVAVRPASTDVYASGSSTCPVHIRSAPQGVGFSVQIPYQCVTPFVGVRYDHETEYRGANEAVVEYVSTLAQSSSVFYRAAADDFQLMYFIGVPLLLK